ncbi:tRNA threonylcarbamoyl adenosine modification protein YeaZ [Rhodovulum imhoffii]|uniref:tRNA threonylcarbamoyl adenosine modification protein YeaZ n=1 Tax=Rhodovulum imhoffii TaxID=365340 RepID=A0A2T5BP33_9RHOB|nr:tRNA (adenosine(37)-N6)-threonylcarbamoyltransferase complex dimerization subunit type 1 TsaB [Rhodovulum imhoffii]MBK5933119.1 tRNA (adenosine(37)-N6)-threonylcarbamoyltransferase complex dimerization subunit type 1 TsaB [Rhodovulum imhoffii]PTN00753.1 tRNA threonylcarbamoyl adenosine modification protein YeaZ [Rhodovulum imhoffii]
MPTLAFDTSAAHCAAALVMGGRLCAQRHEGMARGQAERLVPLLEDLLAEAGLRWHDLSALAVGVGPGNFTGIRIGVSAARGLALALGLPAHGITGFDAFAPGGDTLVTLPAPRGRLYVQPFRDGRAEGPPCLTDPAAPAGLPHRPVYGIGGSALAQTLGVPVTESSWSGIAPAIARVAATRPAPPDKPKPLYLRSAGAALPADPPPVILP